MFRGLMLKEILQGDLQAQVYAGLGSFPSALESSNLERDSRPVTPTPRDCPSDSAQDPINSSGFPNTSCPSHRHHHQARTELRKRSCTSV